MVLQPEQRSKLDATDDSVFYDVPRLVTHVDEGLFNGLLISTASAYSPKATFLT
jgi:hypothetical protein